MKLFIIFLVFVLLMFFVNIKEEYRVGISDPATVAPVSNNPISIGPCPGTYTWYYIDWSGNKYVYPNNTTTTSTPPSWVVCPSGDGACSGKFVGIFSPSPSLNNVNLNLLCNNPPDVTIICPLCTHLSVNSCQLKNNNVPDPVLLSNNTPAQTLIGYNDPSTKVDTTTANNYKKAYTNYINTIQACNNAASLYNSTSNVFVCPPPTIASVQNGFVTCS